MTCRWQSGEDNENRWTRRLNKPQDIQAENLGRSERERVNLNCFEDSTLPLQMNPLPISVGWGGGGGGRKKKEKEKVGKNFKT